MIKIDKYKISWERKTEKQKAAALNGKEVERW